MKIFLFVVLGVVVVLLLVVVSPLALVYFLFDRLCSAIEEFRPRARGRANKNSGGQRLEILKRVFASLPLNGSNSHTTG